MENVHTDAQASIELYSLEADKELISEANKGLVRLKENLDIGNGKIIIWRI